MSLEEENSQSDIEGGIPQNTPDEILDFVMRNDVADKFTVMLKRKPEGGGTAQSLRNYTNYYPNVNTIGREWGPGSYVLVFSWRGEGLNGKKETITREYKLELPEDAWEEAHEEYLEERQRKRLEKKERGWAADAAKIRAQGGAAQASPPSELDVIRKALETARGLGVNIGGAAKPPEAPKKKTFAETMEELTPAIVAIGGVVSPIIVAMITRQKPPEDKTIMNTLLQHALQKPQEDQTMKTVVPFLMGTMKQLFEMKADMEPEEKQGVVEKIFDKIAPMIPAVISMAAMPKAERDSNPMLAMAKAHPDMRQVMADPEMQALSVQKLDETYGFQAANDVLTVMGIKRPPELAQNFRKYPSKGYRTDGTHESEQPKGGDGREAVKPEGGGQVPDDGTEGIE